MDDNPNEFDFDQLADEVVRDTLRAILLDSHEAEMSKLRIRLSIMGIDPEGPQGITEIYQAQLKHENDMRNLAPKQIHELPWAKPTEQQPEQPKPPFTWKHSWER